MPISSGRRLRPSPTSCAGYSRDVEPSRRRRWRVSVEPPPDDLAPPLPVAVVEREASKRTVHLLGALGAAGLVLAGSFWYIASPAAADDTDWELVLAFTTWSLFLLAVTGSRWRQLHSRRQRGRSTRWMDAVSYVADEEYVNYTLLPRFLRRPKRRLQWFLVVRTLDADVDAVRQFCIQVEPELARRCAGGRVVAVYEGVDNRVAIADGDDVYWPTMRKQDWLPDGAEPVVPSS